MLSMTILVLTFLTTLVLIRTLIPVSIKWGLVDIASGHKTHKHDTPLVGGIAMFLGLVFSCYLMLALDAGYVNAPLVLGTAMLAFIGLIDDKHQLSVKVRFIVQIIAAYTVATWGGATLTDMGYLFSSSELFVLGAFAIPVTVFAIVGVINAMNMTDGVDGLAGMLALSSFTLIGIATFVAGLEQHSLTLFCITATIAGFLMFNLRTFGRKHAKIFMGDTGSTVLGLIMASFLISLSQGEERAISPVTALWIFAIPLFDTITVMLRRIWMGASPFHPDRTHLHHLFANAGFTVNQTVGTLAALQFILGSIGLACFYAGVAESLMFACFIMICVTMFSILLTPSQAIERLSVMKHALYGEETRPRNVFVGNLSIENPLEDLAKLLGECAQTYSYKLYKQQNTHKNTEICYCVITTDGALEAKLLIETLANAYIGDRKIDVRPYFDRSSPSKRQNIRVAATNYAKQLGERRSVRNALVYCSDRDRTLIV